MLPVCFAAAALVVAVPVMAQERFDHRGALGVLLGGGLEHKSSGVIGAIPDSGVRGDVDLGLTFPVGHDGNELAFWARGTLGGPSLDLSLTGGYRGYFAEDERVKTFFDLDAALHAGSAFTIGPRMGFGAMYELSSVVGLYTGLGAQVGFGSTLRFDFELLLGVQLRTYLFE
ncbi:MAG: hypothetical protein ACOZIN_03030 [Myxococcota bacterium]